MLEQAVQEPGASAQLEDVDELPVDTSSTEDDGSEDFKEYGGDDRVPLAAPDMKRDISEGAVLLDKQFSLVLQNLQKREAMKFNAFISDPNNKGAYGFRFRLETSMLGAQQCSWECIRSIADLTKLSDRLQKDKHIRGMGYSVPPLRENRSNRSSSFQVGSGQRRLVVQFVRQMFTNFVFLGHSMVLNTFEVPGPVRTKIDTLARLHQTPLISSYLNKQGWNVKSWRKRWFVLYPDFTLRYYESENDGIGIGFRGMVDIRAMDQINHKKIEKTESQRFSLILQSDWQQTQRARVYKFETPDRELRDTWIEALRKLKDGELSAYIPEFSIMDALSIEETATLSGVMRASFMKGRFRRASQIQLEKEKESNLRLLAKLSEMREEQDNFEENQKKEQEEYEREQRKIEDEWSDLKVNMAAAKKTLQREQMSLKTIEREIREGEKKWQTTFENAEKQVHKERLRFNLRSATFAVDISATSSKNMKRRRTVIENSAPSVHAGVLGMLTGESEQRKRDVWYLTVSSIPFLEWADVTDQLNPPTATRMQIAEVFPGKRVFQGRAFVVRSARKDKLITFITEKPSECQKWIRTIKNGLGLLSDSDHEDIDEVETKVEVDVGNGEYMVEVVEEKEYLKVADGNEKATLTKVSKEVSDIVMKTVVEEKENLKVADGNEKATLTTVSKEVSDIVMKTVAAELEAKGIVGETEV